MINSICLVVHPINKIISFLIIMAPELVAPTGTLGTRKCSRDGAYITSRKITDNWLVGQISSSFSTIKLPSKKETLALFSHFKNIDK